MFGFEIAIFAFPLAKMAFFLVWLAIAAMAGYKLFIHATVRGRLSKSWLAVAIILAVLAWGFSTSQRFIPAVRLDTGGVQEERRTLQDATREVLDARRPTIGDVRPDVTDSFDEAIRARQEQLDRFKERGDDAAR